MEQDQILKTVSAVVAEFGHAKYLSQGQVGDNTQQTATLEVCLAIMSDEQGTGLESDLRAKIVAEIEKYTEQGFLRTYNEVPQFLVLVTEQPTYTYRDPAACPANGKTLYSVSVGLPFTLAI